MTKGDTVMGDRERIKRARGRASSYRLGGPSSEHTAALLDELADRLEALSQPSLEEGLGVSRDHALTDCSALDWQDMSSAPKNGDVVLGWIVHPGSEMNPDPFERPSLIWWDDGCDNPGWERAAGWHKEWIGDVTRWARIVPPSSAKPNASDKSRDAKQPSTHQPSPANQGEAVPMDLDYLADRKDDANDTQRAALALQGVVGKRLTYKKPNQRAQA